VTVGKEQPKSGRSSAARLEIASSATSTREIAEGAQLVVDGRSQSVADHENGYWLGGSLFDGVTPQMSIYREENLRSVLSCVRVPDLAGELR